MFPLPLGTRVSLSIAHLETRKKGKISTAHRMCKYWFLPESSVYYVSEKTAHRLSTAFSTSLENPFLRGLRKQEFD